MLVMTSHVIKDPMGSTTNRLFESRAKPEFEASSPHSPRNYLYSSTLTELLNQRKSAHTQEDLEKLSKEFGIELDKVESLVRFVTSPSVIGTAIHSVGKDGEGSMFTVRCLCIVVLLFSHEFLGLGSLG
jgi:hypothetical protein